MFQVNQPAEKHDLTKLSFLKSIATFFDPLGLLSPYTVCAKVLLQEMWVSGVDWDVPVGGDLSMKAVQWFNKLLSLPSLHIPRCLRARAAVKEVTLHTFVDAAQEAYGGARFTRHLYNHGTVNCHLVASKTRVAPLQAVSIPRLELMAAVTGAKLNETIGDTLGIQRHERVPWIR